jgi:predicted dehydrogenase
MAEKLDVAVAGLRFGAAFVDIYLAHPDVGRVGVVEPDEATRKAVAARHALTDTYSSLEELLESGRFDAVHIVTPVRFHADHVVAVLESGRHCMSAVPMATELADLRRIITSVRASGKRYMMAETAVFAREYLYARDAYERGELGDLTFFRGAHLQDLTSFPWYWQGYPPMKYLTHALSPALALAQTRVARVQALGSGTLPVTSAYDNRHPLQSGLFRLERDNLAAEITVAFFATAHGFYEGFSVYGTRGSIEWPQDNDGPLMRHTMDARGNATVDLVHPPDRPDLLPPALAPFVSGGHGGSHPHLVHEFVSAVLADRAPAVDEVTAADWTAPGICAHESALADGAAVEVPRFG